ncbi:MAG: alpha/beta fold hydrolase, partial [Chloroflexi bacterium]
MNTTFELPLSRIEKKQSAWNRFARVGIGIVSWAAVLLCLALAGLVIGVTQMPGMAKGLVFIAGLALIVARWKVARSGWVKVCLLAALVALGPVAVWLSQVLAYTPPILGADGKPLPGSIATMETVRVNGVDEWLIIRGKDASRPVLLYLSGGPGASELGLVRGYNPALEDHFLVVVWEQPGSGKSYSARPYATLTVEQYVADGLAVVKHLRERFQQDKIFVLGSSWGTILGVKMVQQKPDWFAAFFGMGQMVNSTENDILSYEYALAMAREKGDPEAVEAIEKFGPPPYTGEGAALKYGNYLNYVNQYDAESAGHSMPADFFEKVFLTAEFGLLDTINQLRGSIDGMDLVYAAQLGNLNM